MRLPLTIALVGHTTAGKSTVALMLEQQAAARRVPRYTTRSLRQNESPHLLRPLADLAPATQDFAFGSRNARYVISAADIMVIKTAGYAAVVELGRIDTARQLIERYPPGIVILVKRRPSFIQIARISHSRRMAVTAIAGRLINLPIEILRLNNSPVDYVILNTGTIADLENTVAALARELQIAIPALS